MAINIALNQNYKNIEIIVINDDSTDDTERVLENIKDSRLKYIKLFQHIEAAIILAMESK